MKTQQNTKTNLSAAEVARYAVDQRLEIHKDSWFADSQGGTDNAVWRISGKLKRVEFEDGRFDKEKLTDLATWQGVLLPSEFDQGDEADAMSQDFEGLYSTIANEDPFEGAHTFVNEIRNTRGEPVTEDQIELFPVLLLENLTITDAGMKMDDDHDSGLDAFFKLYDSVIGEGDELVTAAYLEDKKELLEAFTSNGWIKLRQTEAGYWVVCRVKEML